MNRIFFFTVLAAAFALGSVSVKAGQGRGRGGAPQAKPAEKPAAAADGENQARKAAEEKARKAVAEEVRRQDAERAARRETAQNKGAAKSQETKEETEKPAPAEAGPRAKEKAEQALGKETDTAAAGKGKGKPESVGQGKGRQADALAKQLGHEQQKHLQRQARLERMLELAKQKGDAKTIERVESLMAKEQSRYEGKLGRMMDKEARIGSEAAAEE